MTLTTNMAAGLYRIGTYHPTIRCVECDNPILIENIRIYAQETGITYEEAEADGSGWHCVTCLAGEPEPAPARDLRRDRTLFWISLVLFLLAAILCVSATAFAATREPDWALIEKTLVAEAASEGYDGMLAVAEVMRARDWSLKPFCASRRKDLAAFVARQPKSCRDAAHRALEAARAGSRTVNGATHYENVEAFGTPDWARGKEPVAKVGRHTFWRIG